MRIFVTGANGVIGSRVVPALLAQGHEVTAVVRAAAKGAALERRGARIVELDLFAPPPLRAAMEGHDAVINLATHIPGSTARMLMPGAWRENDRIQRVGSARLVDAALAAGVKRFIQESFAPIYADQGDKWIEEDDQVRPAAYNRSVLDAEASARRFSDGGGAGVILRFGAFYGSDATQLADMIAFVRRGWMPLPGPPRSYYSSVSHDDAATAVTASLNVPAGVYNVVDDEPLRHRDFADALADALAVSHPRLPPAFVGYLTGSMGRTLARSLRVSNQKLRAESGWAPRFPSAREGFRTMVAH
jgi:nucleoside-diphosphate-sugar epimerase